MDSIPSELFKRLRAKLKASPSTVYRHIDQVKGELYLERRLAALFLANEQGIDIEPFSSAEDRQTLREAATKHRHTVVDPTASFPSRSPAKTQKRKRSQPKRTFRDPFVTDRTERDAQNNAEIYPLVYVFENSVREVIVETMEQQYGATWWRNEVSSEVKQRVADRMKSENKYPWHSRRGTAPILYTDIKDLRNIIQGHRRPFEVAFGGHEPLNVALLWIEEIERTRNIIAHNNPVSLEDRNRLALHARDWSELAKKIHDQLNRP